MTALSLFNSYFPIVLLSFDWLLSSINTSRQFYCTKVKLRQLSQPKKYKYFQTIVYARYLIPVCWIPSVTANHVREQPSFHKQRKLKIYARGRYDTLRKSSNCMTRKALSWNGEEKRKRVRLRNTLCRTSGEDFKKMNGDLKQMERIVQDIFGWRPQVGGLCFSTRGGRRM